MIEVLHICIARKPVSESSVAVNAEELGVGVLNIDKCRIPIHDNTGVWGSSNKTVDHHGRMFNSSNNPEYRSQQHSQGRHPANIILDNSNSVVQQFPDTNSGAMKRRVGAYNGDSNTDFIRGDSGPDNQHGDSGSASRFFKECPDD